MCTVLCTTYVCLVVLTVCSGVVLVYVTIVYVSVCLSVCLLQGLHAMYVRVCILISLQSLCAFVP